MVSLDSVLYEAQQLSQEDQLRLIGALWEGVPEDADLPLHEDWAPELERRVAAIQAETATTIPWETIRSEALARIGHGTSC